MMHYLTIMEVQRPHQLSINCKNVDRMGKREKGRKANHHHYSILPFQILFTIEPSNAVG
jgi:hypothetical protein